MMVIDGHSHACGKFLKVENLVNALEGYGVDKVVLVPGELNSKKEYRLPDIAGMFPKLNVVKLTNFSTRLAMMLTGKVQEIPQGNEHVYQLKSAAPDKVIQFVWVTTVISNPMEYLNDRFASWKFHGVKLHQCWEKFSIESDFFKQVAEWAEQHNLPLFIHLISDAEVRKLIKYKRKHPNLKLIIAHLFGLEIFIEQGFRDENLYFDTSTIQLISDYRLLKAIDHAGAGNILFGTDTPYGGKDNIQKNIDRIRSLAIGDEAQKLILGGNMRRLLNL